MRRFNYDVYYENRSESFSEYVESMGRSKARILQKLMKGSEHGQIIAEVGTGSGDVLNAFNGFLIKIGLDISLKSLQKHVNKYFREKINLENFNIDFKDFYQKRISREEILEGFKNRPVLSDTTLYLINTEPDISLPFDDKSIECMILCDIVEHGEQPIEFMKDAARITNFLLL